MKTLTIFCTASLFAASTLGMAAAQSGQVVSGAPAPAAQQSVATDPAAPSTNPENAGNYATGKPLETQSKEGFWGHLNPLARKKWVHRQVDPIADRANELDQLEAKNANDIRDVDARATAGVNKAMASANAADAHAADASNRADAANSTAVQANARTTSLNGTVQNLDQFKQVSSTRLPFVVGRTALTTKQKADLDTVATALAAEKGYIVEIEGFSRAGVTSSTAMADTVERYLVTAHQVPVYRIYRTGLGKPTDAEKQMATDEGTKPLTNGVRVTVLHNSLAEMNGSSSPSPASN